jgi:plasmid maintenance system antidote protein VapI
MNTLYSAVREMLERHWDVYQIATKLKIDPATVQAIVDMINNIVT